MRHATIALSALGLLTVAVQPAPAAWNNVFQPTLFNRTREPVATNYYYVPPTVVGSSPVVVAQSSPCDTCQPPPTPCTTNYVQRCYYQPVTSYTTQTYYEPVTTYRTSYYYEPVTTYRYSAYYDPCSCGYQQVATPCTSYQLKAQSCPVQSWVARCTQVPVTTYQKSCYWQPQTTCCTTTQGAPIAIPSGPPPSGPPPVINQQTTPAPSITPPIIEEKRTMGTSNLYPPTAPVMPPASLNRPAPPANPAPAPTLKLEGIVMGPDAKVEGQVVHNDRTPRSGARVVFVGATSGERFVATANNVGRFRIGLASGTWNVYVYGADDLIPNASAQIEVTGVQQPFSLVNR